MKAVILAGGRGTRFGELTHTIPKPLIQVAGKSLILRILEVLPPKITECIIVLGHLGEQIKTAIGRQYKNLGIQYVWQVEGGTGGALLSAQNMLSRDDKFLVAGSDDIFGKGELDKLISKRPTYGIYYGVPTGSSTGQVVFDQNDIFQDLDSVKDLKVPRYFGVGAYVFPYDFFSYPLCRLANGELSIPHSLSRMNFKIKVVRIQNWWPVNNIEEKNIAERHLALFDSSIKVN